MLAPLFLFQANGGGKHDGELQFCTNVIEPSSFEINFSSSDVKLRSERFKFEEEDDFMIGATNASREVLCLCFTPAPHSFP